MLLKSQSKQNSKTNESVAAKRKCICMWRISWTTIFISFVLCVFFFSFHFFLFFHILIWQNNKNKRRKREKKKEKRSKLSTTTPLMKCNDTVVELSMFNVPFNNLFFSFFYMCTALLLRNKVYIQLGTPFRSPCVRSLHQVRIQHSLTYLQKTSTNTRTPMVHIEMCIEMNFITRNHCRHSRRRLDVEPYIFYVLVLYTLRARWTDGRCSVGMLRR